MPPHVQESLSDEKVHQIGLRCSILNVNMFLKIMNDLYKHIKYQREVKKQAAKEYRDAIRERANCELQSCIPICMCALELGNSPSNSPGEKKVSFDVLEDSCKRARSDSDFFDEVIGTI